MVRWRGASRVTTAARLAETRADGWGCRGGRGAGPWRGAVSATRRPSYEPCCAAREVEAPTRGGGGAPARGRARATQRPRGWTRRPASRSRSRHCPGRRSCRRRGRRVGRCVGAVASASPTASGAASFIATIGRTKRHIRHRHVHRHVPSEPRARPVAWRGPSRRPPRRVGHRVGRRVGRGRRTDPSGPRPSCTPRSPCTSRHIVVCPPVAAVAAASRPTRNGRSAPPNE